MIDTINPDTVLAAVKDFFEAWRTADYIQGDRPPDGPRSPNWGMGGVDHDSDRADFDGGFDCRELALHIADALNGTPRARFAKLLREINAAQRAENELSNYSKIWERDGAWLTGEYLLGEIVDFLRDKSLIALPDPRNPSGVNLAIPLPDLRDEASGSMISIVHAIPEALLPIFWNAYTTVIRSYDAEIRATNWLGSTINEATIARINDELRQIERRHWRHGERELWKRAAVLFGLDWWNQVEVKFGAGDPRY